MGRKKRKRCKRLQTWEDKGIQLKLSHPDADHFQGLKPDGVDFWINCTEGENGRYVSEQFSPYFEENMRHRWMQIYETYFEQMEAAEAAPKVAQYLAELLLPVNDCDAVLGDLVERYPKREMKYGRCLARIWFYKHVVWSIWPLVRKSLMKWAAFGWVVELIRRKIGS